MNQRPLFPIIEKLNDIRTHINAAAGRDISIESDEEVKNYVSSLGYPDGRNLGRPFIAFLENPGISHDIPRLIVQGRRLLKEVHLVEAVIRSKIKDKIFPIFSQVKSKTGVITTQHPDVLDTPYPKEFSLCFDRKIRSFFRDPVFLMNRIQALSGDKALKKDISNDPGENVYLSKHPSTRGIDSSSLFLSMITDMSESKMVNRFLIDRRNLTLLRKEIESRYEKLFSFLSKFKKDSFERGFAEGEGKRRYLVGLKSPNLDKRRKAGQLALKWLIGVA